MGIELVNKGFSGRFYGPEPKSFENVPEAPVLTPEQMAYDWWLHQTFLIQVDGKNVMSVRKVFDEPGYSVEWRDFAGQHCGDIVGEKLANMLKMYDALREMNVAFGDVRVMVPSHEKTSGNGHRALCLIGDVNFPHLKGPINEASAVSLESAVVSAHLDNSPSQRAVVSSGFYFGAGPIVAAFEAANVQNPEYAEAFRHLPDIAGHLDSLLERFPLAPGLKLDS